MLGRVENTETFVRFLELNLISNLISGSRKIWKCRRGCIALESSRSSCNRHLPSDPKNALFFGYRKDARASLNAHFSWVKKEKRQTSLNFFSFPLFLLRPRSNSKTQRETRAWYTFGASADAKLDTSDQPVFARITVLRALNFCHRNTRL